jgi:hypothetical protein
MCSKKQNFHGTDIVYCYKNYKDVSFLLSGYSNTGKTFEECRLCMLCTSNCVPKQAS